MSLQALLRHQLAGVLNAPRWVVGLSGGLDSTVLLHLLATLGGQHPPLGAVHIHHGLQAAADAWPAHCEALCARLAVPLQVIRVSVPAQASVEQAARQARHQALSNGLQPGEVLMLAHHRDDQAETLVFRLLRGAGVRGLAAMAPHRQAGEGTLLRPLLTVPRRELLAYATAHGLSWVEDPTNADPRADRNYLRQCVLPAMTQRWPQAAASLARSAEHLREAEGLLAELASGDLQSSASPWPWLAVPCLALPALQALSAARQRNALRHFLAPLTRLPDTDHWRGWEHLRDARLRGEPRWVLADGELRRSGEYLWWLSGPWQRAPATDPVDWSLAPTPLALPENGEVSLLTPLPGPLQIRYRQGGEHLCVPGRGQRDLKRWLHEQGVPGFLRARLPLLFQGQALIAVANWPLRPGSPSPLQWQPPTNEQDLR